MTNVEAESFEKVTAFEYTATVEFESGLNIKVSKD